MADGSARRGKAPQNAATRRVLIALRKLHADDTAPAPDDAAATDRRFEQRKAKTFHDKILHNKFGHDRTNIMRYTVPATRFVRTQ